MSSWQQHSIVLNTEHNLQDSKVSDCWLVPSLAETPVTITAENFHQFFFYNYCQSLLCCLRCHLVAERVNGEILTESHDGNTFQWFMLKSPHSHFTSVQIEGGQEKRNGRMQTMVPLPFSPLLKQVSSHNAKQQMNWKWDLWCRKQITGDRCKTGLQWSLGLGEDLQLHTTSVSVTPPSSLISLSWFLKNLNSIFFSNHNFNPRTDFNTSFVLNLL